MFVCRVHQLRDPQFVGSGLLSKAQPVAAALQITVG